MKKDKRKPVSRDAELLAKVMEESANKVYYALDRNTRAIEDLAISLRDQMPWRIEQVGVLRNIRNESNRIASAIYNVSEQLSRKPSFFQSLVHWWEMRRFNRTVKKQGADGRKAVEKMRQDLNSQAEQNNRWK